MKYYLIAASVMIFLSCNNSQPGKTTSINDGTDSIEPNTSAHIFETLTGNKREWKLDSMSTWLGDECENGEFFIFEKDSSVLHRTCVDGKWVKIKQTWKLGKKQGNLKITIGEVEYDLFLTKSKTGKKDMMTLSILPPGKTKTNTKTNKIFYSN